MPPNEEAGCKNCSFRGEVLAQLKGIKEIVEAKLDGIKNEVGSGFQTTRIDIDKIERTQIKQWEAITEHSEKIGANTQKISTFDGFDKQANENSGKIKVVVERLSSFKWVIAILIGLQLSILGSLVWMALKG
jgi:hypothetical protein